MNLNKGYKASQVALAVKNPPANADVGDVSSIPGREDPLEEGMATCSSYSCLGNSMDRRA